MAQPPDPFAEVNPYAAQSMYRPMDGSDGVTNEIYSGKGVLIVHRKAVFPDRCVKSNEPTTERLKRKLYWHHPAIFLLVLFNLLIYAVVAMIVRKTAVYSIPLSKPFKKRRLRFMLIAWSIALAGIASLVAGIAFADGSGNRPWFVVLLLLFPILLLTGAILGLYGCRVVYAKKIDEHFVWMGGVSQEFRNSFPPWPYG